MTDLLQPELADDVPVRPRPTPSGVFNYSDAPFVGSADNLKLAAPVVGIARNATNTGIWLTAADGGVFTYGKVGLR